MKHKKMAEEIVRKNEQEKGEKGTGVGNLVNYMRGDRLQSGFLVILVIVYVAEAPSPCMNLKIHLIVYSACDIDTGELLLCGMNHSRRRLCTAEGFERSL